MHVTVAIAVAEIGHSEGGVPVGPVLALHRTVPLYVHLELVVVQGHGALSRRGDEDDEEEEEAEERDVRKQRHSIRGGNKVMVSQRYFGRSTRCFTDYNTSFQAA